MTNYTRYAAHAKQESLVNAKEACDSLAGQKRILT